MFCFSFGLYQLQETKEDKDDKVLFPNQLIYCTTVLLKHIPVMGDNITAYNSNQLYGLKH